MASVTVRSEGSELGSYTLYVSRIKKSGMDMWQAEAFEGWDMADAVLTVTAMSEHGARNAMQISMLKRYKIRQSEQEIKEANLDYTLDYKDMK